CLSPARRSSQTTHSSASVDSRMCGRTRRLVAGDAIGELAEDVEVAVVPSGLRDQVGDDVPQREGLAGTFVPADCFCVPVAGSNDVVGVGCLLGVLVEQLGQGLFESTAHLELG